jgi:hypothetical protein
MVGDEAFNAEFGELGKLLYRHIYDDDVVPCLPPTSVDASFKHFGVRRIAASQEATWTVSTDDDRRADLLGIGQILESFITRRIDALNWLHVPYSLDDHSPRGYIEVSRNSLDGSTTGDVVKLGNGAPRARSILDLLARATSRLPFEVAIRRVGVGYHSRRNGKEHG